MTPRLTRALLSSIDGRAVELPTYDPASLPERAVQFGTGAFLRGFVEYFLDEANRRGLFDGRVVLVGSTGSGRDAALAEQDGLYTLAVQGIDGGEPVERLRVIGSVSRALSASREWEAVLSVARDPHLELVFSNTTEVGIAYDAADRQDDAPPRSFPAKLARFLLERGRAFGFAEDRGLVVLPCELIERNGATLREIVLRHAAAWGVEPEFARWVERSVAFCDTLVDRIVPGAPPAEERARLLARCGYDDAMLTSCEVYRLFAIQPPDDAARARLRFAAADPGVLVVPDVTPYRERKVRLLNGAHTLLVPVALALGCETVREAVTHEAAGAFVRLAMREEIVPHVDAEGAAEFAEAVLERFANPFVRHALIDITLQATMKTRVRVVPSIVAYAAREGRVPPSLAFGFAAFLAWGRGDVQRTRREAGRSVPADDGAARLSALWAAHEDAPGLVRAALADRELWGADLAAIPGFSETVAEHLGRIRADGMRAALDHHLAARAA